MTTTKPYVPENPSVKPLLKLAGWLVLIVAACVGLAFLWYPETRLWSRYTGGSTEPFGLRQSVSNGRPRLQVDEIADFKAYKARQDKLLGEYGWVDRGQGIVRVPIERAMERLLEQGLPVRKAAP